MENFKAKSGKNIAQVSINKKLYLFNVTQDIFGEVSSARIWEKYHIPGVISKAGL